MGAKNSSKTRVAPFFDALLARDSTGRTWLRQLIKLVAGAGNPISATAFGDISEHCWGQQEKSLRPPRGLLKWLVQNPPSEPPLSLGSDPETIEKRQGLLRCDKSIIDEALRKLDCEPLPDKAWYILEGPSYPDVFLQTPSTIIVIEGKRTERDPTRKTTWMPIRDQLLRHIDCAWEIRGTRSVLGFMVVEGDSEACDVPQRWITLVQESRDKEVLNGSLPHRDELERAAIARAVLGVTTWQQLCKTFNIALSSLPDCCI